MEKREKKKTETKPEDLKKKLEECEKSKQEYLAGWQRSRADFLNYKKEEAERIKDLMQYANESLILRILPILDNFEKAEKELPQDLKNNDYVKGLLQIRQQIELLLKEQGIERIEALGKKFDPNFHEAIEEVETEEKEAGIIIEEAEPGYMMKGKLLCAAKVRVAK